MAINWYPGHMHKARKEMLEVLSSVDIIIELIDARIPYSSQNPDIAKLRGNKPTIKIFNKSDLADPDILKTWQDYLEKQDATKTLALNSQMPDRAKLVIDLCHKMLPGKAESAHGILAMITGIPNVGKSTLINTLAGRTVAKTGNEPAVTKGQQRINLRNGIVLLDTPGILWPKFHNQNSAYRLAITGAIKDTAISHEDICYYLVEYLLSKHRDCLEKRYEITEQDLQLNPDPTTSCLSAIAEKRGCLRAGGRVDFDKVSSLIINEYRSNILGNLTLETPEMIERELAQVAAAEEKKQQEKEQRDAERRKKFNKRKKKK